MIIILAGWLTKSRTVPGNHGTGPRKITVGAVRNGLPALLPSKWTASPR